MKLEKLKQELPETPDFIHEMIIKEVDRQVHTERKIVPLKRRTTRMSRSVSKAAAAVAVCVLATATLAYAGTGLYHMYMEKQGKYGVNTALKGSDIQSLPKQIAEVKVQADYIPEGMDWRDQYHLEYKDTPCHGGFSFWTVLMDEGDLDQVNTDLGVEESEKTMFGEHEGVYLKYAGEEEFNQRMYLMFPEEYRVLVVSIGNDVTKEEAYKVAERLRLEGTDQMVDTEGLSTWSDYATPGEVSVAAPSFEVKANKLTIHQPGEVFALSALCEDTDGNDIQISDISVTLDDVQIADDLSLLAGEDIPEEWKDAVGSDGKLVQNELSYIKKGDGINTLDKVVKTEMQNQKLVLTTATYTNTGDAELRHILYNGSILFVDEKDGKYQVYNAECAAGDGYDFIRGSSSAARQEMVYYSVSEDYGNGGNYISGLKPGESVEIKMGWIVNEKDLSHMYLNLAGDGAYYEISDMVLETGLVDIRK